MRPSPGAVAGLVAVAVAVAITAVSAAGCSKRAAANVCPELPQARVSLGGPGASKLHPKLVADLRSGLPRRYPMVVVVDVAAGADPARLRGIGVDDVRPVQVDERGPYGARVTVLESGAPATTWLVHAPAESLQFLVELPWVTAVVSASAWKRTSGEITRRLGPVLQRALETFGDERPFSVGGLAKASVCLDAAHREELAGLGAIVSSKVSAAECAATIFAFEVPLGNLLELASLPWIVKLEGSRPMSIERRSRREKLSDDSD